jgi:hypothetical protein|nr:MAG TPA: hypothetical protein [Caudoviricetes sp.]
MKLISNAKFGEPVESGTIFRTQGHGIDICIHKICGCGDTWYLNCNELGIDNLQLKSENLFRCVDEAKEILKQKLELLNGRFNNFYEDNDVKMLRH